MFSCINIITVATLPTRNLSAASEHLPSDLFRRVKQVTWDHDYKQVTEIKMDLFFKKKKGEEEERKHGLTVPNIWVTFRRQLLG